MTICGTIIEVERLISEQRNKGKRIGFVPTMGALHEGHLSLLEASKKECDVSICSIFVNPNQFNDKNDLIRYPRTPQKDCQMLEDAGCDIVFMPVAEEIYPEPDTRVFDFGNIDKVLEGAHRPGHFNGVAQVVSRLFDIVKPDKAYFGLKDYQQLMVIKKLTGQLHLPIEIVACKILREPDGLAMSSRNMLLSAEERKAASLIPKIMKEAKELYYKMPLTELKHKLQEKIKTEPLLKPDYIEFCDAETLEAVTNLRQAQGDDGRRDKDSNDRQAQGSEKIICLVAIFSGKIRLIDNVLV